MDILNNNVDSDDDSNISQILLSDDDRKPSAQKDPPPEDTASVKKKTLNRGSALFSHQKNNTDFNPSKQQCDKDSSNQQSSKQEGSSKFLLRGYEEDPFDEEISIYEGHQNHILAINSCPTVTQRQKNWNTKFMVPILVSIHFWYKAYKKELAAFCATLQTSSRNNHSTLTSTFQTQTIKYLDQIKKEFNGATNQYIEQIEAVAAKTRQTEEKKAKLVTSSKGDRPQDFVEYDITKGDTFPCPKCGHMMIVQLDTTETIAAYNQKVDNDNEDKIVLVQAKKSQVQGAEVCLLLPQTALYDGRQGRKLCEMPVQVAKAVVVRSVTVNPKELEEETAPNTMPGLVLMIHNSFAEATCAKFFEDTTASKQDITCNVCSSVFYQMASNPHLGSAKTINGKNIHQLRAEHKGKTAVPSNDTRFHQNRLVTGMPGMDNSRFLANHSKKKPHPPPTETLIDTRAGSLFQPITIDGETDGSNQQPRTLMGTSLAMAPAKEIKRMPQNVRDVKMEAFNRSRKENTTPETYNVVDLMAENLTNLEDSKVACVLKKRVELSCQRGDDVAGCCNAMVQWGKRKKIADKAR
eukprot:jgi/Psemu1/17437/gm1.17437_g